MAISLQIDGKEAALKKGSSIEYVSENRLFIDADDYSLEIELPLAGCPQNIDVFGHLTRKDIDTDKIFFNAVLQGTNFRKVGAIVITGITQECVKVQFLEKRSYQNFFPKFDETFIDELDLDPFHIPTASTTGAGVMTAAQCRLLGALRDAVLDGSTTSVTCLFSITASRCDTTRPSRHDAAATLTPVGTYNFAPL